MSKKKSRKFTFGISFISNNWRHNTSVPSSLQAKVKVKIKPPTTQGGCYYFGYVVLHYHYQFLRLQRYIFFLFYYRNFFLNICHIFAFNLLIVKKQCMTSFKNFNHKELEKYSSAYTLSDMEVFIFPELFYSLVLANIMSPEIWKWRDDPWFA